MNSVLTKISAIKRNPNNPRILKDDKFAKLTQSIKDFPQMLDIRPIVVNDDMIVLGGNMRLKACKEAGLSEVPVIKVDDLTEEQQREFIIKDNVGFGEWDWDLLANEWDTDLLEDWGLELDFNPEDDDNAGLTDEDDTPEVTENPVSKVGDIWLLGEHRVMCGDSTNGGDVALLMNGEKADMVFTDPPYGVDIKGKFTGTILNDNLQGDEFINFLTSCFENLNQYNNGNLYISYEIKNQTLFEKALENCGFKFDEIIIWNKDSASFYSKNKYNRKYEPIFFIENGKELKCEPDVNVWDFAKSSSFASRDENNKRFNEKGNFLVAHPTTKPIGLISKALNNSTSLNNLTLDLFLGSGSTLIASEKKGRKCYGMELDPKYVDVIIKRWQDYTGKKAIHAESGDEFVEVDND